MVHSDHLSYPTKKWIRECKDPKMRNALVKLSALRINDVAIVLKDIKIKFDKRRLRRCLFLIKILLKINNPKNK